MDDRQTIIAKHRQRMLARNTVKADLNFAKADLHPKRQADFFVARQKAAARSVGGKVASIARKNAALFGVAGLATLMFVARRPLADWASRLKRGKSSTISQDKDDEA